MNRAKPITLWYKHLEIVSNQIQKFPTKSCPIGSEILHVSLKFDNVQQYPKVCRTRIIMGNCIVQLKSTMDMLRPKPEYTARNGIPVPVRGNPIWILNSCFKNWNLSVLNKVPANRNRIYDKRKKMPIEKWQFIMSQMFNIPLKWKSYLNTGVF